MRDYRERPNPSFWSSIRIWHFGTEYGDLEIGLRYLNFYNRWFPTDLISSVSATYGPVSSAASGLRVIIKLYSFIIGGSSNNNTNLGWSLDRPNCDNSAIKTHREYSLTFEAYKWRCFTPTAIATRGDLLVRVHLHKQKITGIKISVSCRRISNNKSRSERPSRGSNIPIMWKMSGDSEFWWRGRHH